jgi:hypothetical protein
MVSAFGFGGMGWVSWMKRLAWLVMIVLSLLIIASRKHYTVDVVIAWSAQSLACAIMFLVFLIQGILTNRN